MSGFYYATTTKILLNLLIFSTLIFYFLLYQYKKTLLNISLSNIFSSLRLDKYLINRSVFLDPKDILCSLVLLYHFRIIERRFGSCKFASFLLATFFISNLFEIFLNLCLNYFTNFSFDHIATGPWGVIFALFIPFYCAIPSVQISNVWGFPFSNKTLVYLVGFQMLSTSLETLALSFCGMLAGMVYYFNVFSIAIWLKLPQYLSKFIKKTVKSSFDSSTPSNFKTPFGATFELQRLQKIEALEQQELAQNQLSLMHHFQRTPSTNNRVSEFLQRFGFGNNPFESNRTGVDSPEFNLTPTDEHIVQLINMGFQRNDSIRALKESFNDVTAATSLLLQKQNR